MATKHAVTLCVVMLCGVGAAVAQTEWVQHPANPIIEPGEEGAWDQFSRLVVKGVVWDGSKYHMIFGGSCDCPEGGAGLWHATSTDGVIWEMDPANPVLTRGSNGAWDSDFSYGSSVALIHANGQFHLWYEGDDGIGYATSPDGTVWTKYWGNPVVFDVGPPGSFDGYDFPPESVVFSGGTYRMWGTGVDEPSGHPSIGYAESPDGISWTRHPTPAIDSGPGWDSLEVGEPTVVFDGRMYHMWYRGAGAGIYQIGYAFSSDGITWTKRVEDPVISHFLGASSPEVVFDGLTFHMWYVEAGQLWGPNPGVVNYATSECCATDISSLLFIPAAVCAARTQGSFFQTDVDLNNAGDRPADYWLHWLPRGQANSDPVTSGTYTLAPGQSVRYANVLSEVFGLEPNAVGALAVVSSSPHLLAASRISTRAAGEDGGTFGQTMPAVSRDDFIQAKQRRRILFASENEDLRFNVGCQNGSAKPVTVILEFFDSEGTFLERRRMLLPAFGNDQLNRVLKDYMPVNGYVDVGSDTDGALYYCYGSVVDNLTNDPMTVPPQ
jgi:hypothetical protein